MPKITGRQIWITFAMVLLAAPAFLPAGSAAFRPAWFTARLLGVPFAVWIMLAMIVGYLLLLRAISDALFGQESGSDEGTSS